MHKLTKIFLVTILLHIGICPNGQSGYEKTSWGMSIKKVQGLYPGGSVKNQQNGEATYAVVRPVSVFSTGLVLFEFTKDGLERVQILFPKQGSKVNLKNLTYDEPSSADSKTIFDVLKNNLTLKYGAPDPLSQPDKVVWSQKNDAVFLATTTSDDNPGHRTVGVSYSKIPTIKSATKGI